MADKDIKILAIETSSNVISTAVVSCGGTMVEHRSVVEMGRCSEIIIPLIDKAMRDCGITVSDIDGFGVGCGPGSFTGLRIGIGTIKGLALACRKPVSAISSLDALTMNVPFTERLICSMIDARMGEVYAALYRFDSGGTIKRITDIIAIHPKVLIEKFQEYTIFIGSGAILYRSLIEETIDGRAEFLPDELSYPRASIIGAMALEEIISGKGKDGREILPMYIRPSQAEMKWGNGWFKMDFQRLQCKSSENY